MSLFLLLLLLPLGFAGYRLYRGSASLSARTTMLVMVGLLGLSILRGSLTLASETSSRNDLPVMPEVPLTQGVLLCRDCNSSSGGETYRLEASAQHAELRFTRSTPFSLRFHEGEAHFQSDTLQPGCHLLSADVNDMLQLEVKGLQLELGQGAACSD